MAEWIGSIGGELPRDWGDPASIFPQSSDQWRTFPKPATPVLALQVVSIVPLTPMALVPAEEGEKKEKPLFR